MSVILLAGCTGEKDKVSNEEVPAMSPSESPEPSQSPSPEVQEPEQTAAPSPDPVEAADIAGHPSETYMKQLIQSGSVELGADLSFRPNEAVTRSEFIRWMHGYDNKGIKPYKPANPSFIDVPPDHADYELIEGLHQAGVITGFPDGSMKLDKELTREELCLLWGWYQSADSVIDPIIPIASAELSLKPYSDGGKVGDLFIRAVDKYLTDEDKSYVSVFGKTPKLSPQGAVTRAEAAQWIVSYSKQEE